MDKFSNEIINRFIKGTSDEHGAPRFVHIPERGVLVDLEVCGDVELLNAAIAQMDKELAELQASIAVCRRRMTELETDG